MCVWEWMIDYIHSHSDTPIDFPVFFIHCTPNMSFCDIKMTWIEKLLKLKDSSDLSYWLSHSCHKYAFTESSISETLSWCQSCISLMVKKTFQIFVTSCEAFFGFMDCLKLVSVFFFTSFSLLENVLFTRCKTWNSQTLVWVLLSRYHEHYINTSKIFYFYLTTSYLNTMFPKLRSDCPITVRLSKPLDMSHVCWFLFIFRGHW